ncbi:MAG: hypothetical protein JJU33_06390 [Phycisphaerales bacterium]|nr:hypothetical protein [Phycisphaerales bacterium]
MNSSGRLRTVAPDVSASRARQRVSIAVSALIAVCCLGSVSIGQEKEFDAAAVLDAPRNAALDYWAIWHGIDLYTGLFSSSVRKEFDLNDPEWRPSQGLANRLASSENTIEKLIEISRIPVADFQLDHRRGFATLLPHSGKLRQTAALLIADSRRLMAEGRADEAATRIAAVYRIPGQFHDEATPNSARFRAAIERAASREAALLAADLSLSEAGRNELIEAIDALRTHDRLGFRLTLHAVPRLLAESSERRHEGPLVGERFLDDMLISPSLRSSAALGWSGEEVREDCARFTELIDEAIESWENIEELEDLERRATTTTEFGIIAAEHGDNLTRMRREEIEADDALRNARKALVGGW